MSRIESLSDDAAPAAARPLLEGVAKKLGKAPNLFRTLAHSPAGLGGYLGLSETLSGGLLDAQDRERVALITAQENTCDYCLAAHTAIGKGAGLDNEEILAARSGHSADSKVNALLVFTGKVVRDRGRISDADLEAFRKAGYSDGDAIEVIANVALNTFTNYTNHLAETEVDFPAVPELAAR